MDWDIRFHVFGKAAIINNWSIKYRRYVNKLYYVLSGTAIYEYENKAYHMIPGHFYIFPSAMDIRFKLEKDVFFEHIFFDFISNPLLQMNIISDVKSADDPVLDFTIQAVSGLFESCKNKNGKFFYFPDNTSSPSDEIEKLAAHYFHIIFLLINSITPLNAMYDSRIFETVSYIHDHFNQKISVRELADLVFLETNYFIKLFKKYIGKSPYQYIKDYRLSVAISMIKSGKSIQATAGQCGYLSPSSFSYALKNKLGISPSELQK